MIYEHPKTEDDQVFDKFLIANAQSIRILWAFLLVFLPNDVGIIPFNQAVHAFVGYHLLLIN
jgi:hypothetical protein